MYQAKRPARSEFVPIRNLQLPRAGSGASPRAGKVPLVMVHGWMDVGRVLPVRGGRAWPHDHYVIAPDWRGYGLTEPPGADNYWFPDYLADLDFLLDHYSPDAPVRPGRPQHGRQRRDAVCRRAAATHPPAGQPGRLRHAGHAGPTQAPGRYAKWMDELKAFHRGELALKSLRRRSTASRAADEDQQAPERRTRPTGWPRTGPGPTPRAAGASWATPAHKIINAQLYRVDEVLEIYKRITRAARWRCEASDDSLAALVEGQVHAGRIPRTFDSRCPTCATRRDRRTPATCCTTTSPNSWRSSSRLSGSLNDTPAHQMTRNYRCARLSSAQEVTTLDVGPLLPHTASPTVFGGDSNA